MARKQLKKRSFGHQKPMPSTSTSTVHTPATTLPKSEKTSFDYSRYSHVIGDLKKIATILVVILGMYAAIFVANLNLHLF